LILRIISFGLCFCILIRAKLILFCFYEYKEPLGVSIALLGLSDGRVASSFDDYTIKITNDMHFNNYSTLVGHTDEIRAITELPNQVFASGDKTIRLWNLTSLNQIGTIQSQQGEDVFQFCSN